MQRRIVLGKMLNLRDLGGYPTAEGKTTRWGTLLRGDNPAGLSDADVGQLLERNITTIIDLRSPAERDFLPDELANRPGFSYHFIPMSGGEKLPNEEELIGLGYFRTLERKDTIRSVLETIADAPGGVLFHCMAGKDRTGCIAALLLTLAGVDRLDILADYQVSQTYIRPVIRWMRETRSDLPAYVGLSKPEYLEDCLERLEGAYGSVTDYLRAIGLTQPVLERLKSKLLEE
ncbi:MAG: tyrosine-protein phosphatase [Clostridiales bacterium]|uniref:tyrosine-protein phosphatase n=1 Tax=Flavonifractor porci TaxID=3133422 RepID=UPI0030AD9CFD|nr:tyrosine-protein phosphatase [Clostridiales bacterium]